ncbi:MAG: single-stranded-DNA-specific exonuclease RecJ [Lachnospiraceae bacterium]|nr:single-stranded-DNA-specific exonuclease RecJ [Lachnospiraceae bacterium]
MANWFVAAKKADFDAIAKKFDISPVLARLIRNRDVCGEEEIRKYLYGSIQDLYAPELLKGMDQAVSVIKSAIEAKRKIRVIGDYDIDGVCATYILVRSFQSLGADVDMAIPHRIKDGYGLNDHLIEQAAAEKVELIVTCDNGIAAADQIELAHRLGMQVIVTDHHEVPFTEENPGGERVYSMPPAEAVVDPKQPGETYPFSGICGAVVAWKLAWALGVDRELLNTLLEPAAFATIGDVMELKDENRIIVKEGLKRMSHTSHPGLRALIEVNKLDMRKIEAYHIGFVLGPCVNASGRLESAALSLKLWLEEDYKKAVPMAAELKNLNDSRKEMTEAGVRQAVKLLERKERDSFSSDKRDKVLILYLPDCHESLAGIIAGRIREKYHRPTIVLTDAEEGVKGSGRSIEGYDMFAHLSACKDLFEKFGGHKMAAGLSLVKENVAKLRQRLNENCSLTEDDFTPKVHIDIALPLSYVSEGFIQELELLAPFGTGNPKPVFAQKNVLLRSGRIFGKNRNVVKFDALDQENIAHTLVYFGDVEGMEKFLLEKYGADAGRLFSGGGVSLPLTITYYPNLNEYRGRREIEFVVTNYC